MLGILWEFISKILGEVDKTLDEGECRPLGFQS